MLNSNCTIWWDSERGQDLGITPSKPHLNKRFNPWNLMKRIGSWFGVTHRATTAGTLTKLLASTPLLFFYPPPRHGNSCHFNPLTVTIYSKHVKSIMDSEGDERLKGKRDMRWCLTSFCETKSGHDNDGSSGTLLPLPSPLSLPSFLLSFFLPCVNSVQRQGSCGQRRRHEGREVGPIL